MSTPFKNIQELFRSHFGGILLNLILLLTYSTSAMADACSDCQTQKRVSCSSKCDSAPDRLQYDKCVKECVQPACQAKCAVGPGETRISSEVSEESCRSCLNKRLAEGCPDRCEKGSPSYDRCRKTCAKQRCAQQCALPDAGFQKRAPLPKYACEQCKMNAELVCKGSTACGQGEPGSIACQFHCVAKTCEKVCNEEAAEMED